MSRRNYERLPIEPFGRHLVESGDLDPIYVALNGHGGVDWAPRQLHQWLIGYWCFYHAGVACWMSEQRSAAAFWAEMHAAALNDTPCPAGGRWPRGHERRHFRGAQAIAAVRDLERRHREHPENMVIAIKNAGCTFQAVTDKVREYRSFGPWISFKVADMLDRCLDHFVDFHEDDVFLFDSPREAALMLWRQRMGYPEGAKPKDERDAIKKVVRYLGQQFADLTAPPRGDRDLNIQEIETILCKWKSHLSGHYPLYNDIDEIHLGLEAWKAVSPAAREFFQAMPPRRV